MEQIKEAIRLEADPTFAAFGAEWPYCLDTGLLTRIGFIDRAGAEMRRAQRFQRDLSLVRVSPLDENIDDEAFEQLAFFLQESVRDGIDLAGLMAGRTVMILLPETDMLGAMEFSLRLRDLANSCGAPSIADFTTSETTMRTDDDRIAELIERCIQGKGQTRHRKSAGTAGRNRTTDL